LIRKTERIKKIEKVSEEVFANFEDIGILIFLFFFLNIPVIGVAATVVAFFVFA